ncbi:hypothetical protein KBC75_05160 [Candidatus Shapirobacteria bacterium]|nr:hypothetical protein [Candidatus Shapirobacteria bacterium]
MSKNSINSDHRPQIHREPPLEIGDTININSVLGRYTSVLTEVPVSDKSLPAITTDLAKVDRSELSFLYFPKKSPERDFLYQHHLLIGDTPAALVFVPTPRYIDPPNEFSVFLVKGGRISDRTKNQTLLNLSTEVIQQVFSQNTDDPSKIDSEIFDPEGLRYDLKKLQPGNKDDDQLIQTMLATSALLASGEEEIQSAMLPLEERPSCNPAMMLSEAIVKYQRELGTHAKSDLATSRVLNTLSFFGIVATVGVASQASTEPGIAIPTALFTLVASLATLAVAANHEQKASPLISAEDKLKTTKKTLTGIFPKLKKIL